MLPRHKKLLAALVSTALCAAAGLVFLRARRAHVVPLILRAAERPASFASESAPALEAGPGLAPLEADRSARFPPSNVAFKSLSEEEVWKYFGDRREFDQYDPLCNYRPKPSLDVRMDWPEHPLGYVTLRTNSAGYRRDTELSVTQPDLRILVTGDSHTDGVCNNDENAVHLLEQKLAARFPGHSVEAINVARGGYAFYQYAGVAERYLDLHPDVLVIAVYGGNDFDETLYLDHLFRGTNRPGGTPEYYARVEAAKKIHPGALAQAFNAYHYFKLRPDQIDRTAAAARDLLTEIQVTCLRHSIQLVVAYIPPMPDVQRPFFEETVVAMRDALALTDEDMRITDRMATSFLEFLHQRGVPTVDLRPRFRAATEPLYWKLDHHINLAGHRVMAEALAEELVERAPADMPRVRVPVIEPAARARAAPRDVATPAVAPASAPNMRALVFGETVAVTKAATASAEFKPRPVRESDAAAWSSVWPQVEFDAERHLHWKPGLDVDVTGGDAPDASWRLRTDGSGLRGEREPATKFDGARVLFCGDELVGGGCAAEQALAAATEHRLAAALSGRAVECLDASTPGHFLDAYSAVLEHFVPLAPSACVVVVNGGNDFLEGLPRLATARRKSADAPTPAALEFLDSLTRFASHPRDATLALRQAVEAAAALATRCRALHCEPVFVYVPPASDVPAPGARAAAFADAKLDHAAWSAIDRLGTAWIAELRSRGLRVADLRPLLREAAASSYGASRHLLTRSAHDAVADVLAPELARILSPAAIEASSASGSGSR
jgi:lysophospholipase L1-like esterase